MWSIYTTEYYTAITNKDTMKFEVKWMKLENIILSEVTQTQKDKRGMYSRVNINHKVQDNLVSRDLKKLRRKARQRIFESY